MVYGGRVPKDDLPPAVRSLVEDVVAGLTELANEGDTDVDLLDLIHAAQDAAAASWENANADPYELNDGEEISPEDVPGRRMKDLREEAEMSQDDLAKAMRALGFAKWSRQTVADIERAAGESSADRDRERSGRRLKFAELYGLCIAFGVPMSELLAVAVGEQVVIGKVAASDQQAMQLLVGRGGEAGGGGPQWGVAASLWSAAAGQSDDVARPARDLWRRRRAAERGEI